jgi:hypothetical protein
MRGQAEARESEPLHPETNEQSEKEQESAHLKETAPMTLQPIVTSHRFLLSTTQSQVGRTPASPGAGSFGDRVHAVVRVS